MDKKFHNLLIRTVNLHCKRSYSKFTELGLSPGQPKILENLKDISGCMQKELATACDVEPATITSILPNMEKKGLIKRESNSDISGKRSLSVTLTEKGCVVEKEVARIIDEIEEMGFKGFTKEEKESFLLMFERIYENIK